MIEQSDKTADGPAVRVSVLQLLLLHRLLQLRRGHSGPLLHLLRGDLSGVSNQLGSRVDSGATQSTIYSYQFTSEDRR